MIIRNVKPHQPEPVKGGLLISEPFLFDPNFRRTVVLLSEHNEEGSVGFIMNRQTDLTTESIVPDLLDMDLPVYYGGPVESNTMHYIHRGEYDIPGAQRIADGLYWGGEILTLNELLVTGQMGYEDVRFFVGYSGWEPGQIKREMEQMAWWSVNRVNLDRIFTDDHDEMWANIVRGLGEAYQHLANPPEDPQWN